MIELENVSFTYGSSAEEPQRVAEGALAGVTDVSLRVDAGRCVLVVGESGCGKTTLTRLASGLAPSFFSGCMEGRVLVDGEDIAYMTSWEVARHVGSVFQNPRTQFFNVDSTGEVAFALESQGLPEQEVRARTDATIAELGLDDLANRNIFELSGGEKQRIAYASVWAARPANLVLDEPTSNLDINSIRELTRYLRDAKAQGAAVLVAEHRLWWLMDVADEVVVMQKGRIACRMGINAFRALSTAKVSELGLRVRDLADVRACGSDRSEVGSDAVHVVGVRVSRGKREVLHGIDMDLALGEVVALVGENGAGKTTLARAMLGLCKLDEGQAVFNASDPRVSSHKRCHSEPKERLKQGAMVFQDVNYQLFAESVRAEVTLGLPRACRKDDVSARDVLERLGLGALGGRHPRTLSGGQKQRLAIAACVASERSVLVFDEPTSGLDLASCLSVAALVRELASEGRAVLVVTHDLEFIAHACDRAIALRAGRIVGTAYVEGDLSEVRELIDGGDDERQDRGNDRR